MHFLSTVALVSIFSTATDASRCRNRQEQSTPESSVEPSLAAAEATTAPSSTAVPAATSTTGSTIGSMVAIADSPAATQMCTDDAKINLPEWGLVVANFRVQESGVEGSVCTTYNGMVTLADGQAAVNFTADASLVYDEATINDNKYYSNAGLGENMNQPLSNIDGIPASYSWSRTNTTNFRGK